MDVSDDRSDENSQKVSDFTEDDFVMPAPLKNDESHYEVRVTNVENPCSFYVQTQQQWEVCNERVINPLHNYMKNQPAQVLSAKSLNKAVKSTLKMLQYLLYFLQQL